MKRLPLILLVAFFASATRAQYVYTIKGDSIKLTGASCDSTELILLNHTQGVPGFLFNMGNGRTRFQHGLVRISGNTYLVGSDTLRAPGGLIVVPDIPSMEAIPAVAIAGDTSAAVICTDTARGGLFFLATGTSVVPDSGTVFAAYNAGPHTFFVRNTDAVKGLNALWFGIKRDGHTDNTALLAKALALASSLRQPLYFPTGVYMTGPQTLGSFTALKGAFMDSTIIRVTAGAPIGANVLLVSNQKEVSLENITIDGNAAAQTTTIGGLLINGFTPVASTGYLPKDISLRGVRFTNENGDGVLIEGAGISPANIRITDCTFDSVGSSALQLSGVNDLWVEDCHFTKYGYLSPTVVPAIYASGNGHDTNVNVIHNYAQNTINTAGFFTSAASGTSADLFASNVSDNYVDGNGNGCGIGGQMVNSTITGNIILRGQGGSRGGIILSGNGLIVAHNMIGNGSLNIQATEVDATHYLHNMVIVSDNYVRDSTVNSGGIVLNAQSSFADSNAVKNVDVHDNLIDVTGCTGNAPGIVIGFFGSTTVANMISIHDNRILGNATAACIRVTDSLIHDVKLSHNTYIGGAVGLQLDSPNLRNIQVTDENFDEVGGKPVNFIHDPAGYIGKVFFNTPIKDTINNTFPMLTARVYSHDTTVSANYTAGSGDVYIRVNAASGNVVVTLPASSGFHLRSTLDNRSYSSDIRVKRIDTSANTVTVQAAGSDTIDGSSTIVLSTRQSVVLKAGTASSWDVN